MKTLRYFLTLLLPLALSCSSPTVPTASSLVDELPSIYPDYIDVTIPCNIAPLTFEIKGQGDEYVTRLSSGGYEIVEGGNIVAPSIEKWQSLIAAANGNEVKVEVFVEKQGQWNAYKPFSYKVSPDSIDNYISYRLIPPSYVCYETLTISQRNLTNYDESVIYNNMLAATENNGSCINCHSYKNYRTDNMQFHIRQENGGTFFMHNGKPVKLNMATDSTLSAGVYPAFNPVYDVVAYSVNKTGQIFHTRNSNKVEVQDVASDIIIYNPVANCVTNISNAPNDLEVFPWWSPDGRTLYYGSAHFEVMDSNNTVMKEEIIRYKDIKYDILRRSWNPDTYEFGPVDTIFAATKLGKSATFPRISPDGRYLLFALGEYGCFHVWHKDADLYLHDLKTNESWPLTEANSDDAESYHSWSSNSRWILFSSRREDTNYTRLFIAHVDADGKASKAFVLPQESPDFYPMFDRSYNVPEFMIEPVRITPQEIAEIVKSEAVKVTYSSTGR